MNPSNDSNDIENVTTNCTNCSSSITSTRLPHEVAAYIPFFLAEFLVAIAANAALLGLVVQTRRVKNNSSVYLTSLAIANLLESVTIFTLLVTLVTRRWVFGSPLCSINSTLLAMSGIVLQITHLAIARDRYQAVKDPMKWNPKSKRTYVRTAVIWVVAITLGVLSTLLLPRYSNMLDPGDDISVFACYGVTTTDGNNTNTLATVFILIKIAGFYTIFFGWLIVTSTHYALILRDLKKLGNLRIRQEIVSTTTASKLTWKDKPLECAAEERTTKSLATLFTSHFLITMVTVTHSSVRVIQSVVMATPIHELVSPHEYLGHFLVVFLLPANPVLLLLNRRFRGRVAGLLRCELQPVSKVGDGWQSTRDDIELLQSE